MITRCAHRDEEGLRSSWEVTCMSGSEVRSVLSMSRHRHKCVTTGAVTPVGAKHSNFSAPMGSSSHGKGSQSWLKPPSSTTWEWSQQGQQREGGPQLSYLWVVSVLYLKAKQHLHPCPFSPIPIWCEVLALA